VLYNTGPVMNLTDASLNYYQTYNLDELDRQRNGRYVSHRMLTNALTAPSDVGPASMPNYARLRRQAITRFDNGTSKSLAGQADDPFFLDLRVFDLLYGASPAPSCVSTSTCKMTETSQDTLAGYNVQTIVLQVPKSDVALRGNARRNPVVGVWSDTFRRGIDIASQTNGNGKRRDVGNFRKVSRLGNPLVNEAVIALKDKDRFNASSPNRDGQFLHYVTNPLVPNLIQALYGVPAPKTPRSDLVEIFLTGICKACGPIAADLNSQLLNKDVRPSAFRPAEELRLNMAVPVTAHPNRLGVVGGDLQGFPNGRRLGDDVIDISLDALEGLDSVTPATSLGDGVNANDRAFSTRFPYEALPHDTAVNSH
jgi:hypothetical protein